MFKSEAILIVDQEDSIEEIRQMFNKDGVAPRVKKQTWIEFLTHS